MSLYKRICKNCKYNKDCTDVVEFNYCKRKQDAVQSIEQLYENYHNACNELNKEVEIIEDEPISKLYVNNELQYDLTPKEDLINHLVNDCGCVIEDTSKEENKTPEKIKETKKVGILAFPSSREIMNKVNKINEIIDKLDKGE